MSIRWDEFEPQGYEDMVSVLLSRLHPDAQRIDGKGGDRGRDVQIVHGQDGQVTHAFELKSFTGRMTSARRKQVAGSLKRVAALGPARWTLVVPIDPTPAEDKWFRKLGVGIASPKLWRQIRAQGWHPYMRYRKNVSFCAQDGRRLLAQHFVSRPDTAWIGRGTAFSTPTAKRRCTLLAVWYVEQEEPWIILTDLPPEDAGPSWYALRFWIELGFKAVKSLGWKWDQTRRTDPARVSRHWLVLSVATLLAPAYGTRVEDAHDRRIAPGNLRTPPKA